MSNAQKGEVTIKGPEDKEYTLCLTLGAIAKIEQDLDIKSLAEIDDLAASGMTGLLKILVALLNGGGHTEITTEDMMTWNVKLPDLMDAIRDAFTAAGFSDNEGDEDGEPQEGN